MDQSRAVDESASYAHAVPPATDMPGGATGAVAFSGAKPIAVVVWHGMGQQIKFETAETVIRALTAPARASSRPTVDTRFVKFGDERMWRAEFDYALPGGATQRVHVYEVYWAPLTEGKITIAETLGFLVRAGVHGIGYAAAGSFRRHLFGAWVTFTTSRKAVVQLASLVLTLAAMIVLNFAVATATSVGVLQGGNGKWPGYPLLGDLTADFLLYELLMGGMLLALFSAYWLQRPKRGAGHPSTRAQWLKRPLWALVALAIAVTILAAILVVVHLWRHRTPDQVMWWDAAPLQWLIGTVYGYVPLSRTLLPILAIWAAAVGVSYMVKSFLVQYVGDVAIYVASHRLDRFYETRQAIKALSVRVVSAIYQHGGYDHHICVGHSLGSVIAYDTVNRLVNESQVTTGLGNVLHRTRALLTFGSPLDKTAFLFRAQSEFSDVREAMAAAAQPLITTYDDRPIWINIYSSSDPVSGRLDYYDAPRRTPSDSDRGQAVFNVRDTQAWIPLVAHTQYWTNDAFIDALRALLKNDGL
jgi:hypothetical protein